MHYGDDGILRVKIMEGAVIGREQVKMQMETIERMGIHIPHLALVDARNDFTITKDGQETAAAYYHMRIATAVVTGNPVTRMLSNAYVDIFKPASPVRLFSNEKDAEAWLIKQMTLVRK
jgi:hypothetical protein